MLDRRKENKSAFSTLAYQGLEPRQLLTSVTLVDGLLTIGATTSGSVISLVQLNNSGLLQLTENGENAGQFAPEDVDRVSFFGTPGEDSFTILGNDNSSGSGNDAIDNLMAINFFGGGGDDEFIAQLGDFGSTEILANGGDGNDRLIAESFDGLASSGSGNAQTTLRFFGGDGQDDLRSTGVAIGTTRLIGGGDTDTILGGLADDFLRGGSGNDSIRGGGGGRRRRDQRVCRNRSVAWRER